MLDSITQIPLNQKNVASRTLLPLIFLSTPLVITTIIGVSLGSGSSMWQYILSAIIGMFSVLVILRNPHIGLSLTLATILTIQILPPISFVSSISVLLGGLTFGAYVLHHRWDTTKQHPSLFRLEAVLFFAILFVVWVFVANPASAIGLISNRNWLFTFAQLFILLWLMGRLLTTPFEHQLFMALFALIAVYAAFIAIQGSNLGLESGDLNAARSGGIIGSNQGARYLTVGFIFLYYLRSVVKIRLLSYLALVGMILTAVGIFATLSRTGVMLFVVAFVLLLLSEGFITRRLKAVLILVLFLALFVMFLPSDFVQTIEERASEESAEEETRYGLWRAGMDMFQAHPITGVGIGRFRYEIFEYAQYYLNDKYLDLGAHNMYISILAETGLVGFTLFMLMLLSALDSYWKTIRTGTRSEKSIAIIWMIALIILMIGGMTKHDQYEKLLWSTIGASLCFHYSFPKNWIAIKHHSRLLVGESRYGS